MRARSSGVTNSSTISSPPAVDQLQGDRVPKGSRRKLQRCNSLVKPTEENFFRGSRGSRRPTTGREKAPVGRASNAAGDDGDNRTAAGTSDRSPKLRTRDAQLPIR